MSTVEQFSIWLPDAETVLHQAANHLEGLKRFELMLVEQLSGCQQLIRWAIVRTENNQLLCEGAYLAKPL